MNTDAERDALEAAQRQEEGYQFNSTYSRTGYAGYTLLILMALISLPLVLFRR